MSSRPGKTASAAIDLAKLAERLPALLVGEADAAAALSACDPPLVTVAAEAVARFPRDGDAVRSTSPPR